jgi:MFS family permease
MEIDFPFLFKILDSIVELIAFMLGMYCANIMLNQYRVKKTTVAWTLTAIFVVLGLAPIFQFMDGLFYRTYYFVQYGYAFILLATAVANILIFYFALEIFLTKGETINWKSKIIFYCVAVVEITLSGIAFIYKLLNLDVTLFIGAHMVIGLVIYLLLAIHAFRLSRKLEPGIYRNSVKSIGNFAISLLGVFIFFIIDSFYPYYTIWGFLGWALWLFCTYLAYKGFVEPVIVKNNEAKSQDHIVPDNGISEAAAPRTMKYFILLLLFMGLYEIFDSYTTTFYPMVVSYIIDDFGVNISDYYLALSIASLGLYFVILVAFMCDKIGRKPMIILVFFGMGLGSYFLGISANLSQFTSSLFLMFIFFSSDVWVLIISEEAPKDKRARYSYIVMLIGTIGVFAIPILRSLVVIPSEPHTWVNMTHFAWLAMPLAFLGLFLKETRAFQNQQNRKSIENKWNWSSIFKSISEPFQKSVRNKTFGFIIIGFVLGLNLTTLQTVEEFLSSNLTDQNLVNTIIFVAGVGSILVYLITGPIADKFGRKKIMVTYAILFIIAISGLVLSAPQNFVIGVVLFTIFCQMGYWGCFSLSKMYCVECFETQIRGSCTGWRSFAYAIGLTLGALISSFLTKFVSLGGSYVINAIWIAVCIPIVVIAVLPETKGCELVE